MGIDCRPVLAHLEERRLDVPEAERVEDEPGDVDEEKRGQLLCGPHLDLGQLDLVGQLAGQGEEPDRGQALEQHEDERQVGCVVEDHLVPARTVRHGTWHTDSASPDAGQLRWTYPMTICKLVSDRRVPAAKRSELTTRAAVI